MMNKITLPTAGQFAKTIHPRYRFMGWLRGMFQPRIVTSGVTQSYKRIK